MVTTLATSSRHPAQGLAALLLFPCLVCACDAGYAPPVDRSTLTSVRASADGKTVVFSFQRLVYRPAKGFRAFPDGGIPKYVVDQSGIAVHDASTGTSRILVVQRNQRFTPGQGDFYVAALAGRMALVGRSGQLRSDLGTTESERFLLRVDQSGLVKLDLDARFAARRLELGSVQLLREDGLLLVRARAPEAGQGDPKELWLRLPSGDLRRVTATDHYIGLEDGAVIWWTPTDRLFRAHRIDTGEVAVIPDPRLEQGKSLLDVVVVAGGRELELRRHGDNGEDLIQRVAPPVF